MNETSALFNKVATTVKCELKDACKGSIEEYYHGIGIAMHKAKAGIILGIRKSVGDFKSIGDGVSVTVTPGLKINRKLDETNCKDTELFFNIEVGMGGVVDSFKHIIQLNSSEFSPNNLVNCILANASTISNENPEMGSSLLTDKVNEKVNEETNPHGFTLNSSLFFLNDRISEINILIGKSMDNQFIPPKGKSTVNPNDYFVC